MKKQSLSALVAAISVVVLLSGCTKYTNEPRSGGQPPATAIAQLEAFDGIKSASYESDDWYQEGEGELFSVEGMDLVLSIEIEDGYRIASPEGFLSYASQLVWSINDMSPQGSVEIAVRGGISKNYTWPEMEAVLGEKYVAFDSYRFDTAVPLTENAALIRVSDKLYQKAYGAWPMDAPVVPENLITLGEPDVIDPLALTGGDISASTITSNTVTECWSVNMKRGINADGEHYAGLVTFTLYADAAEVETYLSTENVASSAEESAYASFCFDEKDVPKGDKSILASGAAQEGFVTVERVFTEE